MTRFRLGLVVNPLAGIGGPAGLKGSDGEAIQSEALARGASGRGAERAARALARLQSLQQRIEVLSWPQPMGAGLAAACDLQELAVGALDGPQTSAEDTKAAVNTLCEQGIDLLLFAGGDGTARDICDVIAGRVPVLGVPAGVKMHSGVFAVSPEAAGDIVADLVNGQLVGLHEAEVRDIDESAFREGRLRARHYGEMQVPDEARFLQHVKVGGRESEDLVAEDIAAEIVEQLDAGRLYILGPGSTTLAIKRQLGFAGTLLGVDLYFEGECIGADVSEMQLLDTLARLAVPARIVVTAIGGQGHVFGRGNQQISAPVIRAVGLDNIVVVASKGKIRGLSGRPLLVDTNDPELDRALHRYQKVITGYRDAILYPLGYDQ